MAYLQVENVTKTLGGQSILNGVNLQLNRGEIKCLIGASGCGKSTILRLISGLEPLDSGQIRIGETLLTPQVLSRSEQKKLKGKVGIVFQSYNLFSHLTLLENLVKPLMWVKQMSYEQAVEKSQAMLKKVGLSQRESHYPSQLSGGQQQRGAIARTLVMSPELVLLDEPTSALDPNLVREVFDVLLQLKTEGWTLMIATHELRFAQRLADHMVYMEEGQVVESAPTSQFFSQPHSVQTQKFLRGFAND